MATYEIYLQTDNWLMQIPVNPSDLTTTGGGEHKKYDMLGIGESKGIGKPKLRSWKLSSYFPAEGEQPSSWYVEKIEELATQKKPFRLIINRKTPAGAMVYDTNSLVLLEKWELKDNAGEEGDVYFDLSLTEYREFKAKVMK